MNNEITKNQIGCGYCNKEVNCKKKDPKINKAKLGCKEFKHFATIINN